MTSERCDHIDIDRKGTVALYCTRDATHVVTYRDGVNVDTLHVCSDHAPWKLAARKPDYCTITTLEDEEQS